jgi:hypothetical protein
MHGDVRIEDGQNTFLRCHFKNKPSDFHSKDDLYKIVVVGHSYKEYPAGYLYRGVFRRWPIVSFLSLKDRVARFICGKAQRSISRSK